MPAPTKNKFWEQRSTHGRDKIFADPETMWAAACEYFTWCDKNPWVRHEAIKSGDKAGELATIPISRPYTWQGLAGYLDCTTQTLWNYEKEDSHKDFFDVLTRIREVIYRQKFEGAAVGAFNANLIARDLGIADKQENTNTQTITWHDESEHAKNIDKILGDE